MTGVELESFDGWLNALRDFGAAPRVAVAVSGGADSMALCLLADGWARRRGGRAVGLTVDHGLRADSAVEARTVDAWLAGRDIEHHILPWRGEKPATGIQQAAREARYSLLSAWCRKNGIDDLLVAHHRRDQAETFLLRLMRASGPDGLAGMSARTEWGGVRILRPLLDIDPNALRAFLEAAGQPWIDDPSNADPRYARVRVRGLLPALTWAGLDETRIAAMAGAFGQRRVAAETAAAQLAAVCCRVNPAGFATMDASLWRQADVDSARRVLAAVLVHVGGRRYGPRGDRLRAVVAALRRNDPPVSVTLGGCRIIVGSSAMTVCREYRRLPESAWLAEGRVVHWDDRFALSVEDAPQPVRVEPLGREGWSRVVAVDPKLRQTAIPYPARLTLPMLVDDEGPLAVPFLDFRRRPDIGFAMARFAPKRPLIASGFCLANGE